MGTQNAFGSKSSMALAILAILTACGGGGGDSGTPAAPVATNGGASATTGTAGSTTAASSNTPTATTPSTSASAATPSVTTNPATPPAATTPVETTPAVTDPAGNAQTLPSSNLAMYEQLRQHCPAPVGSSDPAVVACAAGVYVGKDLRDGTTVCTVKLTKDGEVTFTVGDTVHVYKLTQYFRYAYVNPAVEGASFLSTVHISGYSAEDAAGKMHGFVLNVNAKGDGSTRPDDFEIRYTYGDGITADSETICKMPL